MKKLLTIITLLLTLLFTSIVPVFASEVNQNPILNQQISQQSLIRTIKVTKVTLDKIANINVGSTTTLIPTVYPLNATNKNVTWKSSNTKIATVNSEGIVTAIKAGKATITITTSDGKKTAKCTVTVKSAPLIVNVTGVGLNKSSITLYPNAVIWADEILIATVTPYNANNKNVTWNSSDPLIATVDSNGKVVAVKVGMSIITVTTVDGNRTATCIANVLPITPSVIEFTDPNFEKAIRNNLGKQTGDITRNDVQGISSLSISDGLVYNISEIKYFINLSNFSLFNSAVSDISSLSGLTSLKSLSLGNNQISDITPLRGLTNLLSLDLGNTIPEFLEPHQNRISDISALSGLTKLWYLSLSSNEVSNVNPLKSLTKLLILSLGNNPISDADKQGLRSALPRCSITF